MNGDAPALLDSYLGWWSDAGLDLICSDDPSPWLVAQLPAVLESGAPAPVSPPVSASPAPSGAIAAKRPPLPADLPAFDAWIAEHGAGIVPEWGRRVVPPQGPADAPIMVVTDFPEPEDVAAGHFFAGEQGALVTAMLKAIDLDLSAQRRASICVTRPLERRISAEAMQKLAPLIRHQIDLVRPRVILAMGGTCCHLLTGRDQVPAPDDQPFFNHNGTKTAIFAVHHPRMLISRPNLKRHAWEVLKLMRERM